MKFRHVQPLLTLRGKRGFFQGAYRKQVFREAEDDVRIIVLGLQNPRLVILKHHHPDQNPINTYNKEIRSLSPLHRQL